MKFKTLIQKDTGRYSSIYFDYEFNKYLATEGLSGITGFKTVKEIEEWHDLDLSSYELKTVVVMSEEEYNSLKGITFEDLNPELQKTLKNLPDPL